MGLTAARAADETRRVAAASVSTAPARQARVGTDRKPVTAQTGRQTATIRWTSRIATTTNRVPTVSAMIKVSWTADTNCITSITVLLHNNTGEKHDDETSLVESF